MSARDQLPSLNATDFNLPIAAVVAAGATHQLTAFGSAWNAFGWYVVNNSWDETLASGSYRLASAFSDLNLTKGTSFS